MSLLPLAIQSYNDAIELYNMNLKRKYKALAMYIKARHDYDLARVNKSTCIHELHQLKQEAALDFFATTHIANEGLIMVDHAAYQIELVRNMDIN